MMETNNEKIKKTKYPNTYGVENLYYDYCKDNPDYKGSYKEFSNIVNDTNKEIIHFCLDTGKEFIIPFLNITLRVYRFLNTPVYSKQLNCLVPRTSGSDTRKRRKELQEQGVIIKSKENPDGVDPSVYFTKPFYINWVLEFVKRYNPKHLKTKAFYYTLKISKYAKLLKIEIRKNESEDNLIQKYDIKNILVKKFNS